MPDIFKTGNYKYPYHYKFDNLHRLVNNMEIKQFIFNPIQENTYVIWNSDTKEGAIVDCGALFEGEQQRLADFIKENEIHIKYLLNTHMHFDHCLGSHWAADKYGVKLMAHKGDADIASRLSEQIRMFGLPFEVKTEPIGIFIDESSELSLGNEQIKVIETPGHRWHMLLHLHKQHTALGRHTFRRLDRKNGFRRGQLHPINKIYQKQNIRATRSNKSILRSR